MQRRMSPASRRNARVLTQALVNQADEKRQSAGEGRGAKECVEGSLTHAVRSGRSSVASSSFVTLANPSTRTSAARHSFFTLRAMNSWASKVPVRAFAFRARVARGSGAACALR